MKSRKNKRGFKPSIFLLVPEVGLEPTRLAAHDFESRSSANSDTLAQNIEVTIGDANIIILGWGGLVKACMHALRAG